MKRWFITALAGCAALLCAAQSQAHDSTGYSHDQAPLYKNPDWMKYISGDPRLSELSLPGTHDTMAYNITDDVLWAAGGAAAVAGYIGGPLVGTIAGIVTNEVIRDIVMTQSMDLKAQLEAGVRVLDIRIGHVDNQFRIHHGPIDLKADFSQVMSTINRFLDNHPSESVIMRLKRDHDDGHHSWDFATRFGHYMYYYGQKVYQSGTAVSNPRLSTLRGRILILDDFPGSSRYAPMQYSSLIKQDDYTLGTNWDLHDKWIKVKNHLRRTTTSGTYINYLSASGGSFPYFVASGHVSPQTGASRLSTGLTTPGWKNSYPDFPRTTCFIGICTISFEGTNELTMNYLSNGQVQQAGIVMADFPGSGLISSIVHLNDLKPDYSSYLLGHLIWW